MFTVYKKISHSLFMLLVILHHLLNVFVQLANKRGLKKLKIMDRRRKM
jgi:hypothetical protein